MLNKKGFTLVELLAVIVILAIIAVIAVPQVLKIIGNARDDSFRTSIRNIIKAAKSEVVNGKKSGKIEDLKISSGKDITGYWYYDVNKKSVVIAEAIKGNTSVGNISDKNADEYINSGTNFEIVKSGQLLKDRLSAKYLGQNAKLGTTGAETGYILETDNNKNTEPNNYVWFSGQLWRAFKWESDGIRLVTDNSVTAMLVHNTSSVFSTSFARDWLDNVFYPKLKDPEGLLVQNITFDTSTYNYERNLVSSASFNNKVGLLSIKDYFTIANNDTKYEYCNGTNTIYSEEECQQRGYCDKETWDEVNDTYNWEHIGDDMLESECYAAGGNYWSYYYWNKIYNTYINKKESTWTLSPSSSSGLFAINSNGSGGSGFSFGGYTIRPVIKIKNTAVIKSGNGTLGSPYVIGQTNSNGNLSNKTVGEYVMYSGIRWRIQEISASNTTRLIMNGVGEKAVYSSVNNNNFSNSDVKNYLNTTFLNSLTSQDLLVNPVFKLGPYAGNYKTTFDKTLTSYADETTVKVGLPKIGDMFAGQDIRDETGNLIYTGYKTLTPSNWGTSTVYYLSSSGRVDTTSSNSSITHYGNQPVRPVIEIKAGISVKSGNGTFNTPYIIE